MKRPFFRGLCHGIPICLGYLAVSFGFGIFAVKAGLSILETVLISMTNLTSAGQLAGVPILTAGGSLWELALTESVINLRYALMSVSLSQKLDGRVRLPQRLLIAFGNTDEVFAVSASQKGQVGTSYMLGLILLPFLGWTAGTALGAVAGSILPELLIGALGIAIYGMFVAIVVPVAREEGSVAVVAALAIALSCLFTFVPFLSDIPGGFRIVICAVVSAGLLAAVKPLPQKEVES